MSYTYDPQYIERMKEMLMAIGRINLMAASKEEFGRLIDRDLSKNSVSKLKQLSDFSVSAIFHQLEHIVEVETDGLLGLETILERYARTSVYYKERLQGFLRAKPKQIMPKLFAMMDYVMLTDTPFEDARDMMWDEQWADALDHKVDLRMVVLMALGVLPAYSGKGMSTSNPLEVTRSFIMDYVKREGFLLSDNAGYYRMLIAASLNLDDRIASVAVLYKFCRMVCLSFSVGLSRTVLENSSTISGLDINQAQVSPVLWWNEKVEHEFWYFEFVGTAYYMVKCNIVNRTYTKYTLFTGSELGSDIGRVLHPQSIEAMIEGDFSKCHVLTYWRANYDSHGNADTMTFEVFCPVTLDDWARELQRLCLHRLSPSQKHCFDPSIRQTYGKLSSGQATTQHRYEFFAKNFRKKGEQWVLSDRYANAFPGTSYILSRSLYAVAQDHILVQDIVEDKDSPTGFRLIDDKYFRVDREWLDEDISLGDDVGILILGTDQPYKPKKKYLALDYNCTYFPIVGDEIQFPKEERE